MSGMEPAISPRRRLRGWVGLGIATVIGLAIGLFGSIFGPFTVMVFALALCGGGVIAVWTSRRANWSRLLLVFGIAVFIGACAYVLLGLLEPQGSSNGSGSGCELGGRCQLDGR